MRESQDSVSANGAKGNGMGRSKATNAGRKASKTSSANSKALHALTIRMSPKLSFGLELLARLQNRSLNQAVEWALQYALVSTKGDHEPEAASLWTVLSEAWDNYQGWKRVLSLFYSNPTLVSFEERHACVLVTQSMEHQFLQSRVDGTPASADLEKNWDEIIAWAWPKLLRDAGAMELTRLQTVGNRHPLCADLGIKPPGYSKMSIEQLLPAAASFCREHADGLEPGMPTIRDVLFGQNRPN
ncbi:MAG: hypothetical protein KDI60_04860 [Xanthomonadales bacterium]|nr:hypothetical protein [Xanthomonadales bacterium]MCP5476983.1 hypothetical protein [Rhodanobacteraceae bacterium]